jgi:transposase
MCILPAVGYFVKQRLRRHFGTCRNGHARVRYLIVFNLWNGRSARQAAKVLHVHVTTVYRVAEKFRQRGEASLWDGRENNGLEKLSEHYLAVLDRLVRSSPLDHGWVRPTWTREMLVRSMRRKTGVTIHVATMSRALAKIKARRANPRPRVACPWHSARKTRRVNALRLLLEKLPQREAAVYEDEADVHLNPKIGLDWMGYRQQKSAWTPGKNEKRYLAGALDVRTGEVHWVEAQKKDSWLFVAMLHCLTEAYKKAPTIHVILDNYSIHGSKIAQVALSHFAKRVRLHFLPPYCPEHNRIERVWQDLHANVTRNHRCRSMAELMKRVRNYLRRRNQDKLRQLTSAA